MRDDHDHGSKRGTENPRGHGLGLLDLEPGFSPRPPCGDEGRLGRATSEHRPPRPPPPAEARRGAAREHARAPAPQPAARHRDERPRAAACLVVLATWLAAGCANLEPPPPTIEEAIPSVISSQVATTLVIRGTGLLPTPRIDVDSHDPPTIDRELTVTLGDIELESVELVSETALQAVVPANVPVGVYDLTVARRGGALGTLAGAVSVVDQAVGSPYRLDLTVDLNLSPLPLSCQPLTLWPLVDVPLLVAIENVPALRWVAHGGHVHHSDGRDIRFSLGDGTPLAHEIEVYGPEMGNLQAWVLLPGISRSQNTTLHVTYGDARANASPPDAQAVWAQYAAVWHFNLDSQTLVRKDSTANAHHAAGPDRDPYADKLGPAEPFDGISHVLSVADAPGLHISSQEGFTMSGWFRADRLTGTQSLISKSFGAAGEKSFQVLLDGNRIQFRSFGITMSPSIPVTQGTWNHLAATYDAQGLELYLNGALVGIAGGGAIQYDGSPLLFGADDETGTRDPFWGAITEWRIAKTAKSECWIATEHLSQQDPAGFLGVGLEVKL